MKKRTNPLTRRIPRELAGDWRKYLVVFLFLVLTIGFVSGMYVANESMMRASVDGVTTYKLEYGHFELSRAADDTLLAAIETGGKADVRQFYTDKARRELDEKFPGEFRGQFDSEFRTKFDAEFQNQVKQTLLAGGLDADTATAMLDTAVAQAKADGTYQSAYSSAYQSAYTSAYNEAYNEAWAKIADEIDEKYADAEEKYDLNDPDFQAVPVTLHENFYRNEDEDHDNDGTPDGTIRVYTQTDDVNLACLIDGAFPVIIHPDVAYDLMNDPKWLAPHQYVDTEHMYEGEIGKIEGVRFVETTEAKIFHAPDLVIADGSNAAVRDLTVKSASGKVITVTEALSTNQAAALTGREILVGSELMEVASAAAGAAGAATITVKDSPATTPAASTVIYPGEGGAKGRDVYSTLIVGADAYGVTELEGGGLQHIVKQLGYGDDPLNQRASVGWKGMRAAERLVEQYMVRIESASSYSATAAAN